MRYLLVATHVPASGAGGGVVRYTAELARELSERPDIDLHVLASTDGAQYFSAQTDVTVHQAPSSSTAVRSLLEWTSLVGAFREPFDVIHGTKHLLPRTRTAAMKVLTVHDMLTMDRPQDYRFLKRKLLQTPYAHSIGAADLILCVSQATKSRLLSHSPTVAPKTGVVTLAPSRSLSEAVAAEVPALSGAAFALVVGDAGARKNLGFVVDLWPRVRALVPGAVLAVVGPYGWGANERGTQWSEQVASGAISFLGYVNDESLRWCYENAAVVLCPSLIEGFGLPAAEAANFGAPLITSTDPALREASSGCATAVPVDNPDDWVTEIAAAIANPRRLPIPPRRAWRDVASETVDSIRSRVTQLTG